jgi:hypothetical protein
LRLDELPLMPPLGLQKPAIRSKIGLDPERSGPYNARKEMPKDTRDAQFYY